MHSDISFPFREIKKFRSMIFLSFLKECDCSQINWIEWKQISLRGSWLHFLYKKGIMYTHWEVLSYTKSTLRSVSWNTGPEGQHITHVSGLTPILFNTEVMVYKGADRHIDTTIHRHNNSWTQQFIETTIHRHNNS